MSLVDTNIRKIRDHHMAIPYLRGVMGEISNFYNLSARLLIFNTNIPPIINTHTSKFLS